MLVARRMTRPPATTTARVLRPRTGISASPTARLYPIYMSVHICIGVWIMIRWNFTMKRSLFISVSSMHTVNPWYNWCKVDPIVASFLVGAVGVISALLLVEVKNSRRQEKMHILPWDWYEWIPFQLSGKWAKKDNLRCSSLLYFICTYELVSVL